MSNDGFQIENGIIFTGLNNPSDAKTSNKGITCFRDKGDGNGNYCTTNGNPAEPTGGKWTIDDVCYAEYDNSGIKNDPECIFTTEDGCKGSVGTIGRLNSQDPSDDRLYCKNITGIFNQDPTNICSNNPTCDQAQYDNGNEFDNVDQKVDQKVDKNLPCYCQKGVVKPRPCARGTVFSKKEQTCTFPNPNNT
jgi:hypothetical protein